tara:strand:- start:19 stop:246 length:228 start_codon:yes stop_codon:yes gene_type:complete
MQYKDRVEQRKSQIALEQWRTSVKSLEVNNKKGYTETIYNDGSMLVRDHATKTEEFIQSPHSDSDLIYTMLREEK